MSDSALGTGRDSVLSTPSLPPERVPPDSNPPAAVVSVLLLPTLGPEDRPNDGRQSSPGRSLPTHHAALTPRSLMAAGCGRGITETDTLGVAQLLPSTQTDPRLPRRPSSTGTIGRTNVYVSFGAQQPQGATTDSAGPNVRTRVRSPYPNAKPRKRRRAISIKGGKYRTGSRTPVGFTALDATPVFPPYNDHTNHNGQLDFMNPHAERGAANAAPAAPSSCTLAVLGLGCCSTLDLPAHLAVLL